MTKDILNKALEGQRILGEEALFLYDNADLLTLGTFANLIRNKKTDKNQVTFVIDRNINYTNICISGCKFCAFYKNPGEEGGYWITEKELEQKINETKEVGGTQILLQGGLHPDKKLNDYVKLLKYMKSFDIHIHGFSPPEISHIAELENMSVKDVLKVFIDSGLGSIPGGGAEILVNEIRQKISPNKCNADKWLDVMEDAHSLGLKTTATMMFGHIEKKEDIIEHMERLRQLQDKTKGFTAFIPWTFQPANTKIKSTTVTSAEYLRVLALARIFLDNFDNIQASWVTQGSKIAQTALFFGANDLGSTMIEENVVKAADIDFRLPMDEMIRLVQTAGFEPWQRDCFYNRIKKLD
ncbi:MAG: cyclic dehypoxanthinyl futalosine synthase [Desulforegulaceae bacterium]|nr:cyclic dehypoxanthinyl futalosine synthase [Desulforegulaceae bacterium]